MNFKHSLELLNSKLEGWADSLILLMPNLVVCSIVLTASFLLSKYLSKIVKKLLFKQSSNLALVNFLTTVSKIVIVFLGIVLSISILKLDKVVVSFLAGAGVIGIALGFAFQDIAANLISGVALVLRSEYPFKVNDIVETNDYLGTVKEINLRSTLIQTFQGQSILIPNKLIYENPVTNYSLLGQRRIDLPVGVSYGDDLEKVEKLVKESLDGIDERVKDKPVEIFYEEFGDSSINFKVRFWIYYDDGLKFLNARSHAIKNIKKAFDKNDICIPFPIRTLDFGIKGGEKLSSMISEKKSLNGHVKEKLTTI